MRVTSVLQATDFLRRDYRQGWSTKKGSRRTWTRSGICLVRLENCLCLYEILCRRQTALSRNRTVSGGETEL